MPPDLRVTRIGRFALPEPVPVTLLPPPPPSWLARIWHYLFGGPKMAAPAATAKFVPPGPFKPGDALKVVVTATGQNVSDQSFSVPFTVRDTATGDEVTVEASDLLELPNPLSAVPGDTTRQWTGGQAAQSGQDFTQTFSATA